MRKCVICWNSCKYNAKYCLSCEKKLRRNRKITGNVKKKTGVKLCPICFSEIKDSKKAFCNKCKKDINYLNRDRFNS